MGGVVLNGSGHEGERVVLLLEAGFDHAQQGLHEAAAGGTLGAEGKLPPDEPVRLPPDADEV